ncbi:MAG: riboflavin synthase [Polyangia bacterium]
MFTGIVESVGTVLEVGSGAATRRIVVGSSLPVERLPLGASIAVDGVCLTVIDRAPGRFAADLGPETLALTTLVRLKAGDRVHLERPLAVGDALGGHMVAGHVDGIGTLVVSQPHGDALDLEVAAPAEIARYVVPKGSITIDGVSLTVNQVQGNRFGVTLVPHTLAVTLLGRRAVGEPVNLEADLIAKHVEKYVGKYVEELVAHYYAGVAGSRPGPGAAQ